MVGIDLVCNSRNYRFPATGLPAEVKRTVKRSKVKYYLCTYVIDQENEVDTMTIFPICSAVSTTVK